jgi:very-short-patch-repair endonuclease
MTFNRSESDIHSLPQLAKFRVKLRKNLTPAEAAFWGRVRRSSLDGRKFRRQHSIGKYIFDFYCPAEKLAIELDGEGHFVDHPRLNDRSKREFAEAHGIRVLHFENERVFKDIDWVIEVIRSNFRWTQRTTPSAEAAATPPS